MRSLETSQKEKQTQQTHEMERLRAELARMQQSYGHYESTLPLQNPYDTQSVFGTSTLAPPTQPNYQAIGLLSTPLDRRRPPQSLLLQSKSPPLQHGGGGGSSSSLRRTSNTLQILVTAASLPKLTEYLRETLKAVISPPAPLSPAAHLSTLQAMTSSLPPPLRPTEKQLMISHNPAIDMLPSPTLRDRLVQAGAGTAQNFLEEVFPGLCGAASAGAGGGGAFQTPYSTARSDGPFKGIIVWGEDPLNETGWEASQEVLDQWSWLMGSEWVRRANFWRAQRNLKPLLDY